MLPSGLRHGTVKILFKKPLSRHITISLVLEETLLSLPGLIILQNNLLFKIVETHQSLSPLMKISHLPKKPKMWYNRFINKDFSLNWKHLLKLCIRLREKFLNYIYRKVYHMPGSHKKQVKRWKLYARPVRGRSANAGGSTQRSSRKPNYRKIVDDLVDAFSEKFCQGKAPDSSSYLNRLKKSPYKVKKDLHELLLSTKLTYLLYHPDLEKKSKESVSEIEAKLKKLFSK